MTQIIPSMSSVAISSTGLSYPLKTALADAGYKHLEDLVGLTAEDIATELGVALPQAEQVVQARATSTDENTIGSNANQVQDTGARTSSPKKASTAADLLSTSSLPRFSTFSHSLDYLIARHSPSRAPDHGVYLSALRSEQTHGSITPGMAAEVSGPPGSGKTVIAIALALSARGQEAEEGVDKPEVLMIDTEGSITSGRLRAAAESTVNSTIIVEAILSGIHLVRIPSQTQMIAFLHTLDDWIETHPKVKLVIIDTLSYHFRHPGMDLNARRRMMDLVKERIGRLTTINRCAVVVMNQLATKLLTAENKPANFETGDRAVLMPQLGDTWTTGRTLRLVLFRGARGDDLRYAHASSAGGDEDTPWARFDITPEGLPCDLRNDN